MTSDWYQQKFGDLVMHHGIEVCFRCGCRGAGYDMCHSRAHAHVEEKKICLAAVPKGYISFFTALHEIGHIVAPEGSYKNASCRALAEHNATEWAKNEMRKLGLPLRRKEMAKYNRYIGNKVARGLRRGLRHVPSVLRKYGVVG
jgi:hypothetical protein